MVNLNFDRLIHTTLEGKWVDFNIVSDNRDLQDAQSIIDGDINEADVS